MKNAEYWYTSKAIHNQEEWLRNEIKKLCSYCDANGRFDRMMVSLSEETLDAFKSAASEIHWFHLNYDGHTDISEMAQEYHAAAREHCENLLDSFLGVSEMMVGLGSSRFTEIPLFVIRGWLQDIEDICLLTNIARANA